MNGQKHKKQKNQTLLISFFTAFLFSMGFAQQPSLYWLGTLGGNSSYAYAVSANGFVVGEAKTSNYLFHAFVWTAANGMQDIGTLGGDESKATDISADGSIVVGWAHDGNGIKRAFRWTSADGMQDLSAGDYSTADAVSADGSVIAVNLPPIAYRWTASGGLHILESLGGNYNSVSDVSADGSVLTGSSKDSAGNPYAARWTTSSGVEKVGTFYSFARAVSGDGLTITGFETGSAGLYRAFRWTQSGGFQFNIAGNFSAGNGVSYDGGIIVGYYGDGPFRLYNTGELENLNQTYANLITAGSELWDAIDISPDGRFIAGNGTNAISGLDEGFLIDTSGVTLVDHLDSSPAIFALYQNFPNPFNPVTKIRYQIQDSELVKLKVYDISGKEVITLVNENKAAGSYEVDFIATLLPSGTYFYRLQAGPFSEIKKMLLIK